MAPFDNPYSSNLTNKISPLLEGQLPDFIQSDHKVFVRFLKHYYQYLEAGELQVTVSIDNLLLEYPDKDLTVLYSATLSSNSSRGNRIMGHDATMVLGGMSNAGSVGGFRVIADDESTQYKERIEDGLINTKYPIYQYSPGSKQIDGVTSATSQYFANKGLLYAYRDGKRVDPSHLHVKDWLDAIRSGGQPKCNVEIALEEAVTCAMATESYLTGRRVEWDPINRKLI